MTGREINKSISSNICSKPDEPQQVYTTPDSSTDDFYSKFKRGNSIVSPSWSPEDEPSIEEALERSEPPDVSEVNTTKDLRHRLVDTWTEFLAPGKVFTQYSDIDKCTKTCCINFE